MMLHAQRSQYCPIRYMKTMKSYKRYKHIFASRIDSKGSYTQEESPLSFLPLDFWERPPERCICSPSWRTAMWEQPCEAPWPRVGHLRKECVAAQWTPPILFLFLGADKSTCFKVLRRWELLCVCVCLNVPSEHSERLLGVCSWKITRSSPLWGQAGAAGLSGPGYLLPARCLLPLSSLPTWFQPIPDETHYIWTWQLVHQPLWACRIWPRSRGIPCDGSGQNKSATPDRQEWGLAVSVSPLRSPSLVWSSSPVSGYLSEMAAVGCSSLPLLAIAKRFVEGLQEVCECGPVWCLGCQDSACQQKAQLFCQGKLGNLCLWVAREGRYLSVWGQLALPSGIIADYYLDIKRAQQITSTSPVCKLFRLLVCGVAPLQVEKWSVCFRCGLSTVISHHRKDYTWNTQENINKGWWEHHSPKEDQKLFMSVVRRKSTPSSSVCRVRGLFVGITK